MLEAAKSLSVGVVAVALLTGVARADIVIGVAGPMSGEYAAFGEQLRKGARQAVADINQRGGVLGDRVVLRVADDACDPKQAVAVANQLVNAGAVFVDGHFCSGSSIPASQIYHEEDILQISPASSNPLLTEQGFANVFRVSGRDDQQGVIAADHVIDDRLGERIAIVSDDTAYGQGLADSFRAELNRRGVRELLDQTIVTGQPDFSPLLAALASARSDLVYFGGYHPEAGRLIRQADELGLEIQLVAGDALATDEYLSIAGPAGDGTLLTFAPDARKNHAAAAVVREFNDQGFDPEGYTLYAYAAVQVWAQAVEAAGTTALAAVVEQLRNGRFATVLGSLRFDDKGDVTGAPSYVLFRWSNGILEEVTRRIRIEARAFVPGLFVRSKLGACDDGVAFRGDQRVDAEGHAVFDSAVQRFVMRQVVEVVAQRSEGGFALEVETKKPKVKPTLEYALDALADGKLNRRDNDGVENDCHLLNRRATASARNLKVEIETTAAGLVQIHFRGGVRNPLLPRTAPTLDWALDVALDLSDTEPTYRVVGSHDGFPAVEVYVNDALAYGFDPGPPACELDVGTRSLARYCAAQVNKLGGGLDVRITPRRGPIEFSG
jgi:branched-chain amino acid transport system substrate-binding protein